MNPKLATLKIQSAEIEPFWATPEILLFLRMRFSNIFLTYMVWKYQNEIAPTFYYGISAKTNEKDLKIPNLQPPDWGRLFWMTLYFVFINFSLGTFISFLDVSPPSIVECMYVGNYYLSLTSASDQRQCKLAQGTRSRSERVVHGRRCRLCILDSILQQWQFAAAWNSHPTSECR